MFYKNTIVQGPSYNRRYHPNSFRLQKVKDSHLQLYRANPEGSTIISSFSSPVTHSAHRIKIIVQQKYRITKVFLTFDLRFLTYFTTYLLKKEYQPTL